ncbi:MAG: ABC transporter permease [Methylohalobius crimeensis]
MKTNIPYLYSVKSFWARKATNGLTAAGMALVVYVFATVLMLTEGLERTLVATGSPDNVMVTRRGAETEIQSAVTREQANIIAGYSEIARRLDGEALVSKESVVLIALTKRDTGKPSNVTIRGLSPAGFRLRPQVTLAEGRWFRPGTSEIVTGNKIVAGFRGARVGERIRFGLRDWTVVGVFDAGNTGFGSEIWGDAQQLMQAFRRADYSSLIFKLADPSCFEAVRERIDADRRLPLEAERESVFYAEQSEMMANFLNILGLTLSFIFSIGAVVGAVITMHASVASRTREIGTLRALGFSRASILAAFLLESLLIGVVGGVVGIACASVMQFLTLSTMNWQTFAEIAFSFTLTEPILAKAMGFALGMGLVGGFLPSLRAARMDIVDALRAG